MSRFLSPHDLMQMFGVGKSTAYEVFKKFEESGGTVIKLGGKHAREEELIQFLERSSNERSS